tara:strand:- start:2953 stop:3282 length:330 start_codon:yes stop_codon:yes gene_type:complete
MSNYYPDKWCLIKISGTDPHYRVFGTWSGGYLDGDSWRMNSGITSVTEDDDKYYFKGYSGSVYECYKDMYGSNMYGYGVIKGYSDKTYGDLFSLIEEKPKNIMGMDWFI